MTEKELHKLHKAELLEILVCLRKEVDTLTEENKLLKERLDKKSEETDEILRMVREIKELLVAGIPVAEESEKRSYDRELGTMSDNRTTTEGIAESEEEEEFRRLLKSTVFSLIVVAAIANMVSMLVLPIFRVMGTSMTPTLQNDELVMCQRKGNFKRGDIIAFYYNNKILLKRVIATSGEKVDIKEDGTVYVNDEKLDEPYLEEKALGECDIEMPYQVPEQKVFVMGDHRSTSVDSRSTVIGCISEEAIVGKIIFRIWPLSSMGRP